MPTAPLRPCLEFGCPALVPRGRCERHQRRQRGHERRYQTGATAYNSARWVRFSRSYRAEHPFCVNAGKGIPYCTELTDLVDHVQPHRGDEVLFWSGPFAPMCRACHSAKTATEVGFCVPR